jgi:hypothetical protein
MDANGGLPEVCGCSPKRNGQGAENGDDASRTAPVMINVHEALNGVQEAKNQ